MAGRSRNGLTQRSLSEINELSGIGQSYCDIFGSRLNQAKRIAPKRLEQRGPKSGACLPSVPVPAKVRFIWCPLPDSNRCCRRERAVSWASRRRGRVGAVPGLDTGWGSRIQGEGRMPRGAAPQCTALEGSFAEIDVLQRLLELEAAQQRDRVLQIVALFAGDAQFAALHGGLHLQFAVLDLARELAGEIGADALAQRDRLPHGVAGGLLRGLVVERAGLDLAARQMHLQELVHLLQLEVVIGDELDLSLVAVDRGFAALEIEAGRDLALDRGDRIIDLSEMDAGNDVKARHWSVLRGGGFGRDIAREPLDLQRRYPGGQR